MNIPQELVSELCIDNVVLFVGAGISQGAGLPGWLDLIQPLAERVEYSLPANHRLITSEHLLRAAQYFVNQKGRNALGTYLQQKLDTTQINLNEPLRLVACLPISTIYTTNYDDLLERALHEANRSVAPVITPVQLAHVSSGRVCLVKMHGTLEQPETLVITLSDYNQYFRTHALIAQKLSTSLIDKTFLFIGYGLNDYNFNQIHGQIEFDLHEYGRRAYAVMFNANPQDVEDLRRRNIEVISLAGDSIEERNQTLAEWLQLLMSQIEQMPKKSMRSITIGRRSSLSTSKRPYKFLDYFEINDVDIFFGRDMEIEEIFSRVISRRLLVIYGKSGTGKSSLINAGLFPNLPTNYLPLIVRCIDDPFEMIKVSLSKLSERCVPPEPILLDFLLAIQKHTKKTLVVILDQFEEFFIRFDKNAQMNFVLELASCYRERALDIRFIIVIREDFLAELSSFKREIPEIFHNEYRLLPLAKTQAREAITQPVASLGISYETELVERLLDDLYQDGIEPPQLQIVCDRLYDALLKEGNTVIGQKIYDCLGGTSSILHEYLDLVLARFSGDRREFARRILKALITSYDTKIISNAQNIADNISETPTEVNEILLELSRARIVRTVGGENILFELAHECLIPKIKESLSIEEIELKRAQELLRREKETYQQFGRLAPIDTLQIIHKQRESLMLDRHTFRFLLRSAMQYDFELDYWLQRAHYDDQDLIQQLEKDLESQNPALQRNAATLLLRMEISDRLIEKILSILRVIGNPNVIMHLQSLGASEQIIVEAEKAVIKRIMRNMIYVPGGEFTMGSNQEAVEHILSEWDVPRSWIETEMPQHKVTLNGFYIDKYLVTNAKYKEFDENYTYPEGRRDNHPAVSISWHMARAYAAWLGKRLPTEAEWEKAGRGTDGRYYPWGNEFSVERCNSYEAGILTTTPVTKYDRDDCRSTYGCCDMAGNVWEWTSTLAMPYPYDNFDGREDPTTKGARIVRGGSFAFYRYVVRTTYRFGAGPIAIDTNQGFRCCVSEPPRVGTFSKRHIWPQSSRQTD